MKNILKLFVDILFFSVLVVFMVYVLSDFLGVINVGESTGEVLIRLFLFGVPISFFLALVCMVNSYGVRYKWYFWVSSFEVLILGLIVFIFFGGLL